MRDERMIWKTLFLLLDCTSTTIGISPSAAMKELGIAPAVALLSHSLFFSLYHTKSTVNGL
ncbi:hypothetical protein TorRG33x02_227940, partial [Trema orientale]